MRPLLVSLTLTIATLVNAQQQDSVQTGLNAIKVNLISSALFRNSLVLSYERVTRPNQSLVFTAGAVRFPIITDFGSSIEVTEDQKQYGYVVGGEYRFYLRKENKHLAPHGVYLGPYMDYYFFRNDRGLTYTSPDGQTIKEALMKIDIEVFNVGVEVGYQFVIKNRWTIDMVVAGPAVASYGMELSLEGDFDVTEEEILENELLAALTDKLPLIKELLVNKNVNMRGKNATWSAGFRYQVNIGFCFGRKKR